MCLKSYYEWLSNSSIFFQNDLFSKLNTWKTEHRHSSGITHHSQPSHWKDMKIYEREKLDLKPGRYKVCIASRVRRVSCLRCSKIFFPSSKLEPKAALDITSPVSLWSSGHTSTSTLSWLAAFSFHSSIMLLQLILKAAIIPFVNQTFISILSTSYTLV